MAAVGPGTNRIGAQGQLAAVYARTAGFGISGHFSGLAGTT